VLLVFFNRCGNLLIYARSYPASEERTEEQDGKIEEDALGEDRDNIMDAHDCLDDQYKAGEIPKEAYEKRRMELKRTIKRNHRNPGLRDGISGLRFSQRCEWS